MKRSFIQRSFLAVVIVAAAFDLMQPGYGKFKNPVDWLPWKREALQLWNLNCSGKEVLEASRIPGVQKLLTDNGLGVTKVSISQTLKEPVCQSDKENTATWSLKSYGFDYQLRVKFDEKGNASTYSVLR